MMLLYKIISQAICRCRRRSTAFFQIGSHWSSLFFHFFNQAFESFQKVVFAFSAIEKPSGGRPKLALWNLIKPGMRGTMLMHTCL